MTEHRPETLPDQPTLAIVRQVSEAVASSRYFRDVAGVDQAGVKILAGRELGLGPIAAIMGLHIIDGKIELSANLLAARVNDHPRYGYRVTDGPHDDRCSIEFTFDGEPIGTSTFTEDDRARAGLGERDGVLDPRTPWAKHPRNMMFARALSNGVRWFCPDVFYGTPVYVDGELSGDAFDTQLDYFNPDLSDEERRAALVAEAERLADLAAAPTVIDVGLAETSAEGPPAPDAEEAGPTAGADPEGEPAPAVGLDPTAGPQVGDPDQWSAAIADTPAPEAPTEQADTGPHNAANASKDTVPPPGTPGRSEALTAAVVDAYGTERKAVNAWNRNTHAAAKRLADLTEDDLDRLLAGAWGVR